MTAIAGTNIPGSIVPFDTADTFGTHNEIYGIGGWRSVENIAARDAITTERRVVGMLVKTIDTGLIYTLFGGITNSNWQLHKVPTALNELTDVFLSNVQPGQTLITDGINWYNSNTVSSTSGSYNQGSFPLNTVTQVKILKS